MAFRKGDVGTIKYYRAYLPLPLKRVVVKLPGGATRLVLFLWYQFITAVFFAAIFLPYGVGRGQYSCSNMSYIEFTCDRLESSPTRSIKMNMTT